MTTKYKIKEKDNTFYPMYKNPKTLWIWKSFNVKYFDHCSYWFLVGYYNFQISGLKGHENCPSFDGKRSFKTRLEAEDFIYRERIHVSIYV